MRYTHDILKKDLIYPCTFGDLQKYVQMVPRADVRGIQRIHITNRSLWHFQDGAYRSGGGAIITLSYAVNNELVRIYPTKYYPIDDVISDWAEFGGKYFRKNGRSCVKWQHRKAVKRYIQFVLYHEIGHHVYRRENPIGYYRKQTRKKYKEEEDYCDNYSRQLLSKIAGLRKK